MNIQLLLPSYLLLQLECIVCVIVYFGRKKVFKTEKKMKTDISERFWNLAFYFLIFAKIFFFLA